MTGVTGEWEEMAITANPSQTHIHRPTQTSNRWMQSRQSTSHTGQACGEENPGRCSLCRHRLHYRDCTCSWLTQITPVYLAGDERYVCVMELNGTWQEAKLNWEHRRAPGIDFRFQSQNILSVPFCLNVPSNTFLLCFFKLNYEASPCIQLALFNF